MLNANLIEQARAIEERIVALRRAIHAEPELGLDTPKTLAKVREELADLPLEWREGTSATGAVATLKGAKPGRRVLLRGDMDALPMDEQTNLPFASKVSGCMHACGHDTHTAMLAGAARVLCAQQGELAGEVMFMFQPGEEGFHGARHMLEDGLLDPLPEAAFALHVWPNAPHGRIEGRAGAMMASADQLEITVTGKGGHAAMPYDAVDPVPVAAEIVLALQSMVTRRFNATEAAVITVTQMNAGSAHNVIPNTVDLKGTIRTLSPERRAEIREAIREVAENIARAHRCSANVTVIDGFPATMNDERAIVLGDTVASNMDGAASFYHRPVPNMGAEDFSYVLEKVPGAMFFLGAAAQGGDWQGCAGLHNTRMVIDESVMPIGTAFLAGCATHYLEHGWG